MICFFRTDCAYFDHETNSEFFESIPLSDPALNKKNNNNSNKIRIIAFCRISKHFLTKFEMLVFMFLLLCSDFWVVMTNQREEHTHWLWWNSYRDFRESWMEVSSRFYLLDDVDLNRNQLQFDDINDSFPWTADKTVKFCLIFVIKEINATYNNCKSSQVKWLNH